MRIFGFILLVLMAVLPVGPLPAQDTSAQQELPFGRRVAFIDIERIIDESRAIRAAIEEVDAQLAEQAAEIDRREREFRRLRFDMDRQERLISEDERARRRDELVSLQEEIDRLRFELEQELRARERQMEPLLERIYMIISDVAKREGVGIVLRGEVVIWGDPAMDLTPAVVRELDARQDEVVELFRRGVADDDAETTAPAGRTPPSDPPAERPGRTREDSLPLIP
jgi:outer membrane protein